jgi:NADP-dependent 3-hydroxy acid dehydrogenase YdfG
MKKVSIIIGATGGIGEPIAHKLHKEGYVVVLVSKNKENLNRLKKEFTEDSMVVNVDVTKEEEVVMLFNKVIEKFGRIDVFVSSVGLSIFGNFEDMTKDDFDKMFGINVAGVFYCLRECVRKMKTQQEGGQIVIINSLAGLAYPQWFTQRSLYCATKFAVRGLVSAIEPEMKELTSKVKIAMIYPSVVATNWALSSSRLKPEGVKRDALQPEDIVYAVEMVIKQGKNSNISEIVIQSPSNIPLKKKRKD